MFEKLKKKVSGLVSKVVDMAKEVKGKADMILISPYEFAHQRIEQSIEGSYLAKIPGASHFVEVLIMVIIAVAVGLPFKNQIIAFITSIATQATTNASNLFK